MKKLVSLVIIIALVSVTGCSKNDHDVSPGVHLKATSTSTITVRAHGVSGAEHISVTVGGVQAGAWTLTTSYTDYSCTTTNSGTINVNYDNDASGRDVQIDYITVNGTTRQAEVQATNTGVYQNSKCGGSNSEWLHCNGYINFGDMAFCRITLR